MVKGKEGTTTDCILSPAGRSSTGVNFHSFSDFSRALSNIQWLRNYLLIFAFPVEGLLGSPN